MAILSDEMRRLVDTQRLAFVATVCPDGSPNLSPKGTTAVWDDRHLAFADIASPGTVSNLLHDPRVEVNVVDPWIRKGFRFKGKARVLAEGDEAYEELLAFFRFRGVRSRIRNVVLVEVEQVRPLLSPVYFSEEGATEEDVRARWAHYWATVQQSGGEAPE